MQSYIAFKSSETDFRWFSLTLTFYSFDNRWNNFLEGFFDFIFVEKSISFDEVMFFFTSQFLQ